MTRRARARELVVIAWRDIPAQVNGGAGVGKRQHPLPTRFQRAIDRAAVKAGKRTANEYVAEWRRYSMPLPDDFDGDFTAAIEGAARQLEEEFPPARLRAVASAGGWATGARSPELPEEQSS